MPSLIAETTDVIETFAHDALFALQLEIARKADELARRCGREGGLNLQCWLLAEAEVLGGQPLDRLGTSAD
jgi:hypothetical protein